MTRMNATRRMSPLPSNHDTQLRPGRQQCRTTLSYMMPQELLRFAASTLRHVTWETAFQQTPDCRSGHGKCPRTATL